ncbi:MAG: DUF6252 family protein [Flavobacterium sp. JAD_PAG50586_2]|nr:MAG: DUF6252 family protein [Flavobacterium sp. JAD_PAG50586_2]
MKTIKHISLALVLAVTTILSSCSSDSSGGGGSAAAGTIKAKAGSTNFTSLTQASYASMQGGMLVIQGSDATGKAIQLVIAGATEAGTYTISDDNAISVVGSYTEVNLGTFDSTTWAAPYENSGSVGTITISEITATAVKGTFNFTGKNQEGTDTKAVTNGSFNVNFQGN